MDGSIRQKLSDHVEDGVAKRDTKGKKSNGGKDAYPIKDDRDAPNQCVKVGETQTLKKMTGRIALSGTKEEEQHERFTSF